MVPLPWYTASARSSKSKRLHPRHLPQSGLSSLLLLQTHHTRDSPRVPPPCNPVLHSLTTPGSTLTLTHAPALTHRTVPQPACPRSELISLQFWGPPSQGPRRPREYLSHATPELRLWPVHLPPLKCGLLESTSCLGHDESPGRVYEWASKSWKLEPHTRFFQIVRLCFF